MKILPISVPHEIARHYHRDARDFAGRFDTLWEDQLHKTGRIKSFVDLVMGCECAMKCHVFLGRLDRDPIETYGQIRGAGHDIVRLSGLAEFMPDREIYDSVANELGRFSVFIRYSLDAYSVFFPTLVDLADAPIHYSKTIGNNAWVLHMRQQLEVLIEVASPEFTGQVDGDIGAILDHERQMEAFMRQVSPRGAIR